MLDLRTIACQGDCPGQALALIGLTEFGALTLAYDAPNVEPLVLALWPGSMADHWTLIVTDGEARWAPAWYTLNGQLYKPDGTDPILRCSWQIGIAGLYNYITGGETPEDLISQAKWHMTPRMADHVSRPPSKCCADELVRFKVQMITEQEEPTT